VSIDPVDPPELYPGAPYHYATIARSGGLVFAAGACPLDASGRVVGPGDLEAQTSVAVDNLFIALRAAGAEVDDVLKTTVYVVATGQADLVRAWNVVAERFAPSRPPSTLLGVSVLGYTDQLVEIEAVAVTE
jgi:enamine deaminase RidA (YjgF/YER057c/UK114 family)